MSDVSKITAPVAVGAPADTSHVTKLVLYVAFSASPVVPVRKKARGTTRIYAEPESY